MALPLFSQGAFAVDANATPEQIAQKRAYIAAMMPRFGSAKYVGEGLGQLATGVVIGRQTRKLNEAESAGRKSAEEMFGRLFGTANSAQSPEVQGPMSVLGMTPSGASLPPPVPVAPSNPEAIASDSMTALGKGATPEGIKAGLVARGMPEHIADGFIMNFQDESGLNPGINEIAPIVPGSRGGFGLAQWTGPRRKALEAFAAERGMPVSDPGVQMDFLMTELQGPEAAAWEKISGAQNAGEAGAAIVNSFLRPAEEHRRAREAEYLGGTAPSGSAAPAPTSAPAIPINELYMALQNPWMSAEEKGLITSMIAEQQQASDPMRQLEMRKAEIELAQLENPTQQPPEDFATRMFTLNALQIDPQSEEGKVYLMTGKLPDASGGDVPAAFASLDMQAKAAGLVPGTPEYQAFMRSGGGAGAPAAFVALDLQAKAAGFEPGTPEYQEFMATRGAGLQAQAKAEGEAAADAVTGLGGAIAKGEQAIALIDQIANDPALPSILGIVQGNIPAGTPLIGGGQAGSDLNAKIEQLQGKVFLEAFESLKGGGAITQIEGDKAERAIARLQRTQSPEAYKEALAELRGVVESGMKRARERANNASGNLPGNASASDGKKRLKWNPATESFE